MMRCNLCRWRVVQQTPLHHAEQDLAAHSDAAAGTQDTAMLLTAAVRKNKAGSPDGACTAAQSFCMHASAFHSVQLDGALQTSAAVPVAASFVVLWCRLPSHHI